MIYRNGVCYVLLSIILLCGVTNAEEKEYRLGRAPRVPVGYMTTPGVAKKYLTQKLNSSSEDSSDELNDKLPERDRFLDAEDVSSSLLSPATFVNKHRVDMVIKELEKFTRPITVLEIVIDEICYSRHLATLPHIEIVSVVLALGSAELVMSQAESSNYRNMIVLDPHEMGSKEFHKLSMCEHFDVVIVPDLFALYSKSGPYVMRALTRLGDITFFEGNWEHVNQMATFKQEIPDVIPLLQDQQGVLYRLGKKKQYLERARFTQSSTQRTYRIESDYTKKFLVKDEQDPVKMIPGINLITFVMLRGRFPHDEDVVRQIATLHSMQKRHNDLVLGNMLIQGARIRPIDFADENRNTDMDSCIKQAITLFDGSTERLDDPAGWLRKYDAYFAGHIAKS